MKAFTFIESNLIKNPTYLRSLSPPQKKILTVKKKKKNLKQKTRSEMESRLLGKRKRLICISSSTEIN